MNTANPRFSEKNISIERTRFTERGRTVSCFKELHGRKYVADGINERDALFNCYLLISNTSKLEYNHGKGEFYEG